MADRLLIGIDLGSHISTVVTSAGTRFSIETTIGKPKDAVAANFLGKEVLFGDEATRNRLACNIFRPLMSGDLSAGSEDLTALIEFLHHLVELSEPEGYNETLAVFCVDPELDFTDRGHIITAMREILDGVHVGNEATAVAIENGKIGGSIVVDIGASGNDVCRVSGAMPEPGDSKATAEGGFTIDQLLIKLIAERYPGSQVSLDMSRRWKEEFSFVGDPPDKVVVTLPVSGKKQDLDITKQMKEACESILPSLISTYKKVLDEGDPEYQPLYRENTILSGGGSQIRNLATHLEEHLTPDVGHVTVTPVTDAEYCVAEGALKLADILPREAFE